jgi:RNA polymerase sigma factor (sigma-70 family)
LAGVAVQREATSLKEDDASPETRAEFERLYRTYGAAVRRHLAYLTGQHALAEDLAQETFGRLYERELEDDGAELRNPQAWLLTVASNLAYNHFRGESRRASRESFPGVAPTSESAPQTDVDDVLDVRRALGELDSRDRIVLMLRHSGFSYAEIAEAVGVAPSSVGTILARAQARFRTVYEGAHPGVAEKE